MRAAGDRSNGLVLLVTRLTAGLGTPEQIGKHLLTTICRPDLALAKSNRFESDASFGGFQCGHADLSELLARLASPNAWSAVMAIQFYVAQSQLHYYRL